MINHIQVTTVFVKDQDKAKVFYTDVLGLNERIDTMMGENFRWLEVAPEKGQASISLAMPFPGMPAEAVGGPTGMIFDVSDVKNMVKELKAKGATITQEPTEQAWGGIEARVVDPDGNEFGLVQRTN